MGLEYFPTFTHEFKPNVGKYSLHSAHLGWICDFGHDADGKSEP